MIYLKRDVNISDHNVTRKIAHGRVAYHKHGHTKYRHLSKKVIPMNEEPIMTTRLAPAAASEMCCESATLRSAITLSRSCPGTGSSRGLIRAN